MIAKGNSRPEVCATNLLKITRGEISYDRIRGRDGALIDQADAIDAAAADAEWTLQTYEPRIDGKAVAADDKARSGDFDTIVNITRRKDETDK
jgi:hypothetical protein